MNQDILSLHSFEKNLTPNDTPWNYPLYSPHENSLNPRFVDAISLWTLLLLSVFGAAQLYGLLRKHELPKVLSVLQLVKFILVFVAIFSLTGLYGFTKKSSILIDLLSLLLVIAPIHVLEISSSPVAKASALLFWVANSLLFSITILQDIFSPHKIYFSAPLTLPLEVFVWVTSVSLLVLENLFFESLVEVKELHYNILSSLSFSYVMPLMQKSKQNEDITLEDLPVVNTNVEKTYQILAAKWNKPSVLGQLPLLKRFFKTRSLFFAIANTFNLNLIIGITIQIIGVIISYTKPFLLAKLIVFINEYKENNEPIIKGYFIGILMCAATITQSVLSSQSLYLSMTRMYSIDSSLTYLLYSKSLILTPHARKSKTTGEIINLITTDVSMVKSYFQSLPSFISAPLSLIICLVSLYKFMGIATFGGIAAAGILLPSIQIITTGMFSLYIQLMKDKDKRTSFVNELLVSLKSIKLYSWEGPMLKRLTFLRGKELDINKKLAVYRALETFVWACIPFFMSAVSYLTFTFLNDIALTPDIVFPALALFGLLDGPILSIPGFLSLFMEALGSLKRLTAFLLLDEVDEQVGIFVRDDLRASSGNAVEVRNADFLWAAEGKEDSTEDIADATETDPLVELHSNEEDLSSQVHALTDINFTAEAGKLTCIVGRVGSGKTTLLRCILGELPCTSTSGLQPSVHIKGNIAYCPQSPWILNASVKQNILFGHSYDPEFYKQTIKACELLPDLKTLPDGDATIVGEKGISLSGGQKARVSLARAVYARADIYLFDDILSAVDSHVGKSIITNVLSDDGIIGDRTKILATNSVKVLEKASLIYLMKDSKIGEFGTYESVSGELATLIKDFGSSETGEGIKEPSVDSGEKTVQPSNESSSKAVTESEIPTSEESPELPEVTHNSAPRRASVVSYNHVYPEDLDSDSNPIQKKTGDVDEIVTTGGVKFSLIVEYCKACNYKYVIFYLLVTLITSTIALLEKYLLTYWSQKNYEAQHTEYPVFYLSIYFLLGITKGLFILFSSLVIWSFCFLLGSRYFHSKMAESILRSPMSFFETTPVGRILNRFTDDISAIDLALPWMFVILLELLLPAITTLIVIVYSLPIMIFVIIGLLVLFNYYRLQYIPATRQLKRLQKIAKSPVIATIQEAINGVDTIKAYGQVDRFTHKSKSYIKNVVLAQTIATACNMWLSIRLQNISALVLLFLSSFAIYSLTTETPISAALFGFTMTYALSVANILTGIIGIWAELEIQTVSIERIAEYCNLKPEAEMINDFRPPSTWPSEGVINFVDYSTRYRDNLDPILHNINLSVKASEKIGIVGRTGAGKSSLTLALFRIIEPIGGHIEIDNINTSSIGLFDLRHNLNIIPQESHIVKGSVRENLDPFDAYSDDKIWKVLQLAHLKDHIEKMKTEPTQNQKDEDKDAKTAFGLEATLDEGGSNLSLGQKQLLSLARALLNDTTKILVLDEATASVDFQTDKIIQETIRSEFMDTTILTIAHRLETIMDSDKVLVLDKGEVKEFDTPEVLLKDELSIFYSLCKEGGYLK